MSEKIYRKLIRDKIPEIISAQNKVPKTRILSEDEFNSALKTKLIEESQELSQATTREDVLNEISDVYEVLDYIKQTNNLTDAEIEQMKLHKKTERGGFDQKLFLESVKESI